MADTIMRIIIDKYAQVYQIHWQAYIFWIGLSKL